MHGVDGDDCSGMRQELSNPPGVLITCGNNSINNDGERGGEGNGERDGGGVDDGGGCSGKRQELPNPPGVGPR